MIRLDDIKTRNDFADFLKIKKKLLTYILYVKNVDSMYTSFTIPKKSGGERIINAPSRELKSIQKKLAVILWEHQKHIRNEKNIKSNISHAFEKDKSILTNAKIHRNKRFVLNVDLENFFDSFHFGRVRGFFAKSNDFKLPLEVATIIAQLSCYKGCLPQGAPSSPIITNLMCQILDMRILKIAKKYKLDYTRYADDLTFSTNNKRFLETNQQFIHELHKEIVHAGFAINESKTRLLFKDSKQQVTGLVVNKKINVDRCYYKTTRAMANTLYLTGSFTINGTVATTRQLEGRFSFINQVERYSKEANSEKTHSTRLSSSREEQYRKFLFYKYFLANEKPLILTEGKTDVRYIKAALKSLVDGYPDLLSKSDAGAFKFKLSFLNRTKRLRYFFKLGLDGADTMQNICNFYFGRNGFPNYMAYFKTKFNIQPRSPVILIFDNELDIKEKPLYKLAKHVGNIDKDSLSKNLYARLSENLYIATIPIPPEKNEAEMEDLFDSSVLSHKIDGRSFSSKAEDGCYGKDIFSKYIMQNYATIDFSQFKPFLNCVNQIVKSYSSDG